MVFHVCVLVTTTNEDVSLEDFFRMHVSPEARSRIAGQIDFKESSWWS
jgi:hypothetical protein